MTPGITMCGVYITKKVPVIITVLSVLVLILGSVGLGMVLNDDYWSDEDQNLYISSIICIVSSGTFLLVALLMFYQLRNAQEPVVPPARPYLVQAAPTVVTTAYPGRVTTAYPARVTTAYPAQLTTVYPGQQVVAQPQFQYQYQNPPPYSS